MPLVTHVSVVLKVDGVGVRLVGGLLIGRPDRRWKLLSLGQCQKMAESLTETSF